MSLIVEDEYINDIGTYLKDGYEKLDSCVGEYRSILQEITQEVIKSGKTHDALVEYKNQVYTGSGASSSSVSDLATKYSRVCSNYIDKLDKADGDLY